MSRRLLIATGFNFIMKGIEATGNRCGKHRVARTHETENSMSNAAMMMMQRSSLLALQHFCMHVLAGRLRLAAASSSLGGVSSRLMTSYRFDLAISPMGYRRRAPIMAIGGIGSDRRRLHQLSKLFA